MRCRKIYVNSHTFLLIKHVKYHILFKVENDKILRREKSKMLNLNQDQLATVAATAAQNLTAKVADARLAKRWQNAIIRALGEIEINGAFMHFDAAEGVLVIWSQRTSEIYEASNRCQCKAFAQRQPCWHRAAARLIKSCIAHQTQRLIKVAALISPNNPKENN